MRPAPYDQTGPAPPTALNSPTRRRPAVAATPFTITKHHYGETIRLILAGDLDTCTAETLVVFARNATGDHDVHTVLVDLHAVDFLDAAGITALLRIAEQAGRRHITLRITGAHDLVEQVLRITGTDRILA